MQQTVFVVGDSGTSAGSSNTARVFGFRASVCTACLAGKYQDAVVIPTNPPEAARSYSGNCGGNAIGTGHARSMLDSAAAWSAAWDSGCTPAAGQWMQIDLGSNFRVHGVVTQCHADAQQFVTEMEVQHSLTTSNFVSATTISGSTRFFLPNTYSNTLKSSSFFSTPVTARYIRIVVHAWVSYASIRAAVLTSLPIVAWNACADCGAGTYSSTTADTTPSTCQNCPSNTQAPVGSTELTSCVCNAGYTNTSGLINLARACSAGGCTVTGPGAPASPVSSPSALVDGDVSEFATLTHTWAANNDWLMIDLGQTAFVNHVRVFNRNRDSWCVSQPVNTCESRLNNFQIRVGDSSTFSNNPVRYRRTLVCQCQKLLVVF
jgi:hypothetical protein